ncbi:MAG: hypothetical protein K9J79_04355 [Desulfobacteraceae bacterium]|nr:hypothetical protein [Desulfobacteraceae bacterium]MCF8094572.1 hypothetical protein [Desulfobacteraceae bacterium]
MGISRLLAEQLLKIGFVRRAVNEGADLSIFRQKPSGKMLGGLACIAVSYIACWPVISGLGVLALYINKPVLIAIGGPIVWTVNHFLCMLGVYLAGADHSKALVKYLVRIFIQRHAPDKLPEQKLYF